MTPSKTKVFFSAAEVAEKMGVDVETVYRWARKGQIGFCPRIAGQRTYRFLQKHIDDFLNGVAPTSTVPKSVKPSRHPKYALSK